MPSRLKAYGKFLANRYKNSPNIIWVMGGDIQGDIHPEVWRSLATSIKSIDHNHLMTYHPRGRYTSAKWWSKAKWLDFHTFQSGHRKYGERMGNKDYPIPDNTEEDNWMYVDSTWAYKPIKPVLDAEPSYEDIPEGDCTILTRNAGRITMFAAMPTGVSLPWFLRPYLWS